MIAYWHWTSSAQAFGLNCISLHRFDKGVGVGVGVCSLFSHPYPRRELTSEQQRRRSHHTFHQPFTLIDQSTDISVRPFFAYIYQQLYEDIGRRCHLDNAILDYNYERLRQCLNIMTQERIRYGFYAETVVGSEQLRIDEYALAMEFYLQMDGQSF